MMPWLRRRTEGNPEEKTPAQKKDQSALAPQTLAQIEELRKTAQPPADVKYMRTKTLLRTGLMGGDGEEYLEAFRCGKDGENRWLVQKQMTAKDLALQDDPALSPLEIKGGRVTCIRPVRENVTFWEAVATLATYQNVQPAIFKHADMKLAENEYFGDKYFREAAHSARILFDIHGDPVITDDGAPVGIHEIPESEITLFRKPAPKPDLPAPGETPSLFWDDAEERFVRVDEEEIAAIEPLMHSSHDDVCTAAPLNPVVKRIRQAANANWSQLREAEDHQQKIQMQKDEKDKWMDILRKAFRAATADIVKQIEDADSNIKNNGCYRDNHGKIAAPPLSFSSDQRFKRHSSDGSDFIFMSDGVGIVADARRDPVFLLDYETLRQIDAVRECLDTLPQYGGTEIVFEAYHRKDRDLKDALPVQSSLAKTTLTQQAARAMFRDEDYGMIGIKVTVDIGKVFDPNRYPLPQGHGDRQPPPELPTGDTVIAIPHKAGRYHPSPC